MKRRNLCLQERIRTGGYARYRHAGIRYRYDGLAAAAEFIDRSWTALGYEVKQQLYEAKGLWFANLELIVTQELIGGILLSLIALHS
jgi:hypothetical protein